MIYRDYKGKKVSVLGMGAMRLPVKKDVEGTPIDFEAAKEIIDYAVSNGIPILIRLMSTTAEKAKIFSVKL